MNTHILVATLTLALLCFGCPGPDSGTKPSEPTEQTKGSSPKAPSHDSTTDEEVGNTNGAQDNGMKDVAFGDECMFDDDCGGETQVCFSNMCTIDCDINAEDCPAGWSCLELDTGNICALSN